MRLRPEPLVRPVSSGLRWAAWLLMGFLYLPILTIIVYSFNRSRFGSALTGLTTQWYVALMHNQVVLGAVENTLILAAVSTLISTVLGTLLGFGLQRYRFPGQGLFNFVMYVPVVTPDIVLAVGLLLVFALFRQISPLFELGLPTMILAHITFQVAFVAIVVRSRLSGLEPALEEAARDLNASYVRALRYVVLPLAAPGILAGALLAFTLSIDDFVLSFFTSGPESTTLPLFIYGSVRRGITPEVNALSSLIVLGTLLLIFAGSFLQRREAP